MVLQQKKKEMIFIYLFIFWLMEIYCFTGRNNTSEETAEFVK